MKPASIPHYPCFYPHPAYTEAIKLAHGGPAMDEQLSGVAIMVMLPLQLVGLVIAINLVKIFTKWWIKTITPLMGTGWTIVSATVGSMTIFSGAVLVWGAGCWYLVTTYHLGLTCYLSGVAMVMGIVYIASTMQLTTDTSSPAPAVPVSNLEQFRSKAGRLPDEYHERHEQAIEEERAKFKPDGTGC